MKKIMNISQSGVNRALEKKASIFLHLKTANTDSAIRAYFSIFLNVMMKQSALSVLCVVWRLVSFMSTCEEIFFRGKGGFINDIFWTLGVPVFESKAISFR